MSISTVLIPIKFSYVKESTANGLTTLSANKECFELNQTSEMLWQLVDGERAIDEIIDIIKETYTALDDEQIISIHKSFDDFHTNKLLSFSKPKGSSAEESNNKKADRLVNYHIPSPDLLWNLESLRQIIIGILDIYPDNRMLDKIDLSEDGLNEAISKDVDTAGSNKTSQVTPYKGLTASEPFRTCSTAIKKEIQKLIEIEDPNIVLRGHAYYKKEVSMGWHSNHGASGLRIYCSWAEQEKMNYFRYLDPETGDIITEWEPAGWTVKIFRIPKSPERLWHCIHSSSRRFALGFGIMD